MLIPLIPKDPDANDFTCRDGEIDLILTLRDSDFVSTSRISTAHRPILSLIPEGTFPTANIRIPLQEGDAENAALLLNGEISRVEPSSAERLTQAITEKAALLLKDLTIDYRRQGLFLLPLRAYTLTVLPDGTMTYPSPQAIVIPTDFPPHPEITASHVATDCLSLSLRFPVRPHRLTGLLPDDFPPDRSLRIFISYPLYIPEPKEIHGSIGSVRSAAGGNATGIRFGFLSMSSIKASVAAPEKYYEMVGNPRTGYRISSKSAPGPDYSTYAEESGYVMPFPRQEVIASGFAVAADTDPLDWIADWVKKGEGYLPASLPNRYWHQGNNTSFESGVKFPHGIDKEAIISLMETQGMACLLMTRPMTFSSDSRSRRNTTPNAIRTIAIHGLEDISCIAILFGSSDCRHWEAMRIFDPHVGHLILSPPRVWWRLAVMTTLPCKDIALMIDIYDGGFPTLSQK